MPDPRTKHIEVPFSGRFWTTEPALIGNNFRTLKNLRYTDTHIKGVSGMAKINVTALTTCLLTRNAFHYRKSQPAESHILIQALTTAGASQIKDNTGTIPATCGFSATALWTDTASGLGRFSEAPDGQMIYANGTDVCIWGGDQMKCGAVILSGAVLTTAGDSVTNPKDYTTEANNTKTDSANVFTVGGSFKTLLIGTTRPAKGATITFTATVNATANTLTIKESTAGDWNSLSISSDGTRNEGNTASYTKTGKISWPSTVTTTKPKYLEGYYLYWYQFTIDDGSAEISHITLDLPFQAIIDMWDGIYRDIARFYVYTTTQADNSINVYRDDYYETSSLSYSDVSALTATTQYLEIGFAEKQTGIYFAVPSGFTNSTAATVASIDYWNGTAYATVGSISDGTSTSAISLAKSGIMSWNNTSLESERLKQYANAAPLYYYRVKFDETLSAGVRINHIGGIIASLPTSHFKFPVFAQGRVLLCCEMAGEKNKAICSSKFMPQVFNGLDSINIYFGEEGELTCGIELFSLFGAALYSLLIMFKDNETWIIAGSDIDQWENNTFLLSSSIGCPAPLTLKTINLHAEPGAGVNRSLAIWQGANGIYMSDGRAPIPISGDIKEYFDPQDSRCITASKVGDSTGFVDPANQEYHWIFASGTAATTLNTELVYDIARNKWFEIDRTADLQCGVTVHDTDGNGYAYGFLDSGYMERLEYGTTFDEGTITHTVQFGDIPLGGLAMDTRLSRVKLLTVAKSTGNITCTHYSDAGTNAADVAAVGTITMGGIATSGETFVIDTQTFTWKNARSTTGDVAIGANAPAAVTNLVTAISADLATVTAIDGTGDTVIVTAATAGYAGNLIVFTEDSTNMTMDGSGVLGGTTAGANSTATAKTMSSVRNGYRLAIPYFNEKLDGNPYHSFKLETTAGFEPLTLVATFHPTHED